MSAPDGLLIVDKPSDWTSHDVVAKARRWCATRKVGHAGTLDPMATGVLVLGVGRATRFLTYLVGCDKDYDATIRLGVATNTDDAQGETTAAPGAAHLDAAAVAAAARTLTGEIMQVPSAVSAIKVGGVRSYHRARAGEEVALAPRPVTVSRFDIGAARADTVADVSVLDVDVRVTVSSGTYVRALARDLGAALDSAGHLVALRRTRVGSFTLDRATPLADLDAIGDPAGLPIIGLADAAREAFSARELSEAEARSIAFGQRIPASGADAGGPVAAFAPDGTLVALIDEGEATARSLVVFAPASS